MSDRDAKALAEPTWAERHGLTALDERLNIVSRENTPAAFEAAAILGTTGLFIADVTKHEPIEAIEHLTRMAYIACRCGGWDSLHNRGESYFDHITPSDRGAEG